MEYQSLIQLNKTLLAKKVMTPLFLVSVSLFSLVFSDSCSWWCHSFSSLPMQLLSHAFDKTWIFLICNGIVVVIANTSSITTVEYNHSSSPPPLDAKAANYNDVGSVIELLPEPGNAVSELLEEKENDVGEPEKIIYCITGDDSGELESEEDESETCFMRMEEEEEDEDQDEDEGQVYDHDHEYEYEYEYEEEGGEEGMDKLSTEELNKKFEDFITKMKEELRIQLVQQQQLILSY